MNDILIGVIIGGLIASLAPIVMLISDYRRWQRQARLDHLRFERTRLEKIFRANLKKFSQAVAANSFTSDFIMDFVLTMPKEVSASFKEFLADPDKTDAKCNQARVAVVLSMKKTLAEIDGRIEAILFQKPKFFNRLAPEKTKEKPSVYSVGSSERSERAREKISHRAHKVHRG
jgi:hypothetical protein